MKFIDIKKAIITTSIGAIVFIGTAITGAAQNVDAQYRQWQRAQARAEQERQDYLRTRRPAEYMQWQRAQQKAQREYMDYQQARTGGSGWNNGSQYRIYRNGSYYNTDRRGAELLRQAVNRGYAEGYTQGQRARRYDRTYDYDNENYYRSGTSGYQSYVARDQYQYYYQQGFRRGYEDGYNSTTRYGYRTSNGYSILGSILNTILNFDGN